MQQFNQAIKTMIGFQGSVSQWNPRPKREWEKAPVGSTHPATKSGKSRSDRGGFTTSGGKEPAIFDAQQDKFYVI
jgi:hypothetical protein